MLRALMHDPVTELVSRVLYVFRRSNHLSSLRIAPQFKPFGSATLRITAGNRCRFRDRRGVLLRIRFTADLCYHRNG